MASTIQRRIAAGGGVVLLTLAVFALLVSIAQAAPSTPLRGPFGGGATPAAASTAPLRGPFGGGDATFAAAGPAGSTIAAGRGGVFVRTRPVAASTAAIIGGIAVSVLAIALVAFAALGSGRSRRRDLASVTSLDQAPSRGPAMDFEDRERKAA